MQTLDPASTDAIGGAFASDLDLDRRDVQGLQRRLEIARETLHPGVADKSGLSSSLSD